MITVVGRLLVTLLSLEGLATVAATPDHSGHLLFRQNPAGNNNGFDPADLSYITKLAAIGDSYSAGIGAGDRLGSVFTFLDPKSDYACSRYKQSYPSLIHNDHRLGDPAKRKFQFLSCSGAKADNVLSSQIPDMEGGQQAILISIGGNDAELLNTLNTCIFQVAVLNQEQVALAKVAALTEEYAWAAEVDWDQYGRTCEGQLDRTGNIIKSGDFGRKLDEILTGAKGKLGDGGMIFYTGYAKFFAEDLSTDCDNVSWTTWIYKAYNAFQPAQKLTVDHRRRMNELVDAMNDQIKAAVERAGSSVTFVDYDEYIGRFHGRYCEKGVDESTTASNLRPELLFYEMHRFDPLGYSPWKRSSQATLANTVEGQMNIMAQITLLVDKEAQLVNKDKIEDSGPPAQGAKLNASIQANLEIGPVNIEVSNILPDGYGRVFHPQVQLHQIIANLVIWQMTHDNRIKKGPSTPSCSKPGAAQGKGPECDTKALSGVPANIFQGDASEAYPGVYSQFCQAVDKAPGEALSWTVDVHGKQAPASRMTRPRSQQSSLESRFPPPSAGKKDSYDAYRFRFEWKPKGTCNAKCGDAYNIIVGSTCGKQGSYSKAMTASASLDVGCGIYSYTITGPDVPAPKGPDPPTVGARYCYPKGNFASELGGKEGADAGWLALTTDAGICLDSSTINLRPKDIRHYNTTADGINYNYNVWWQEGCESSVNPMNLLVPIPDKPEVFCMSIMRDNFWQCWDENKGLGGVIHIGCLLYEFKPSSSPPGKTAG